ncbi:MAG: vWA domain-containing protein [Egibacteraceae bacterium]
MVAGALRGYVTAVVAAGWLGLVVTPAAAAQESPELTVLHVDRAERDVALTVAVRQPPGTDEGSLGAEAFTARHEGESVPLQVRTVDPATLDVAILVDTSRALSPSTFRAARGTAVDFLLQLPAGARTVVIATGGRPQVTSGLTADPAATLIGLSELAQDGDNALFDAVPVALRAFGGDAGRTPVAVIVSGVADTVSQTTAEEGGEALADAGAITVAVAVPGPGATDYLEQLVEPAGGRLVSVEAATELVGHYDAIARDLANLYELTAAPTGPGRLELSAATPAGVADARVELWAGDGTAAGRPEPPEAGARGAPANSATPALAVVTLLALAGLAVAAGGLLWRRSHRSDWSAPGWGERTLVGRRVRRSSLGRGMAWRCGWAGGAVTAKARVRRRLVRLGRRRRGWGGSALAARTRLRRRLVRVLRDAGRRVREEPPGGEGP